MNADANMARHLVADKEPYTYLWPRIVYIILQHCISVYALICIYAGRELITGTPYRWQTVAFQLVMNEYCMLCANAGTHRLWSHRSWQASFPVKLFLVIGSTIQVSTPIVLWAKMHRIHHKYSDTTSDPHDARRGFFFSHIGWLLSTKHPDFLAKMKEENVSDLENDPFVKYQNMCLPYAHYVLAYFLPMAFFSTMYGESLIFGFVSCILRYHATAHRVFSVNSLTHVYGWKPYSLNAETTTARENPIVAFVAQGEWHNYHHTFAWDYANAELGALQQWNLAKMFIDLMAMVGLASNRKRATASWEKRKAQYEAKTGKPFFEELEGWPLFRVRITSFGVEDPYGEEDPRLLGTQIGPEELKEKGAAYENTQHLLGIEPEETPEGKKVQ
jgi:stearoyl-CoA desaturase (delta-9 desaturase)